MCVINLKKRVRGPVVAWKVLQRTAGGRLVGLNDFVYQINKTYLSGPPGFQAFVNKEDALAALEESWLQHHSYMVRKVLLYRAAKGIISNMSEGCNGKPGWTAREIYIPRKGQA